MQPQKGILNEDLLLLVCPLIRRGVVGNSIRFPERLVELFEFLVKYAAAMIFGPASWLFRSATLAASASISADFARSASV